MRNLKITLEYNGTRYSGWQKQKHKQGSRKKAIQEVVESGLRKILRAKTKLVVSGRTDAGVHAKGQVANFKTNSKLELSKIQLGLNAVLPDDIAVVGIEEVNLNFHSRFSAKSKLYRYTILNRTYRSAIFKDYCYLFPHRLDVGLMKEEAKALLGRHNFRSFQATERIEKNPVRTIRQIKVTKDGGFVHIDIEADGFLYNMVRNIAGTLIKIGRGRFKKGELRKILESRDRRAAGPKIPSKGLSLVEVKY